MFNWCLFAHFKHAWTYFPLHCHYQIKQVEISRQLTSGKPTETTLWSSNQTLFRERFSQNHLLFENDFEKMTSKIDFEKLTSNGFHTTGLAPTTTQFVNEHSNISPYSQFGWIVEWSFTNLVVVGLFKSRYSYLSFKYRNSDYYRV